MRRLADERVSAVAGAVVRAPRSREERRADNEGVARSGAGGRFACECADSSCRTSVELAPYEYVAVREVPGRFLVAPGHERDGCDMVVEIDDRYRVVERPPSELFLG